MNNIRAAVCLPGLAHPRGGRLRPQAQQQPRAQPRDEAVLEVPLGEPAARREGQDGGGLGRQRGNRA